MNQLRALVSDIELCAYLDGELSAERQGEVEAWLVRQPEARAKLEAWRQQGRMLRASFGRIAQEPLPRQMTAALLQQTEATKPAAKSHATPHSVGHAVGHAPLQRIGEPALRARPVPEAPRRLWRNVALALLGLSASGAIIASGALQGVSGKAEPQALTQANAAPFYGMTRHAAEAHAAFSARAEKLVDVRSADPSVLTAAAIQSGLEARLPGGVAGLQLLGLRLTPGEAGMSGLLVYESGKNGRVSLFVTRGGRAGAPGIVLRETNGLTIASFSVEGTGYALTAAAPRDQMVDWASALRATLVQPRSLRGS